LIYTEKTDISSFFGQSSTNAQIDADELYARRLYNEQFSQGMQRDDPITYDEVLARQLQEQDDENAAGPSRLSTSAATLNQDDDISEFAQNTDFYMDEDEEFFRALAYMPILEPRQPRQPRTGVLNISHNSNEFDEDFGMDDDDDFERALSSMPISHSQPHESDTGSGIIII
jgi:hypothetical protein